MHVQKRPRLPLQAGQTPAGTLFRFHSDALFIGQDLCGKKETGSKPSLFVNSVSALGQLFG